MSEHNINSKKVEKQNIIKKRIAEPISPSPKESKEHARKTIVF